MGFTDFTEPEESGVFIVDWVRLQFKDPCIRYEIVKELKAQCEEGSNWAKRELDKISVFEKIEDEDLRFLFGDS